MKAPFFTAPLLAIVLGLALGACFDSPILMEEQSGAPENQGNPDDSNNPDDNTFAGGDSPAQDSMGMVLDRDSPTSDSLGTSLGGSDSSTQNPGPGSRDSNPDTTTAGSVPDADDPATLGNTWVVAASAPTAAANKHLYDVEWGGGRFVAVGEGGTILSSPDGESWTAAVSGVSTALRAIVWAPPANGQAGRFVAVGDRGTVLISPDAETWTPGASGSEGTLAISAGVMLTDVAWNGTVFAAVGYQHFCSGPCLGGLPKAAKEACCVPSYSTQNTIATSSDGITWIARSSESIGLGSVTPSSNLWQAVAAAGDGRLIALKSAGSALISPDGVNWVAGATVGLGGFTSLAWGGTPPNQGWVAVGGQSGSLSSGGQIKVSADGSSWHLQESPGPFLNAVIWTGSRFVAVGAGGSCFVSDASGTWMSHSVGTSLTLYGVAYRTGTGTGARFVAVGSSGTIVRSP
jgi:hypothetical protein